ncbi:hypothetical protein ABBQ32_008573 [Trebouxia sp. C0010 RCD-2024]
MGVVKGNKPVTSRYRQFCLHTQLRQRAPFSCANQTQHRPRRHSKRGPASCGGLTVAEPVPQDTAGSVSQSFSFSTYRDDGALSEVSIADCLDQETLQHQADHTQIEPHTNLRSTQSSANNNAAPPHSVQVSAAAETARRRQLRQCYPASHSDITGGQALGLRFAHAHSNFLERRPKVQIASRLQGCTTEPVPVSVVRPSGLIDGERQLALWYQYDVAQRAAAQSLALQSQLGHKATNGQIAAALGLPAPFSLSKCLTAGKSAKLQLVAGNMGLVYKVAHQYHKSRTVCFADLVQAGVQGLDKGLRMYNPGRGAKLSTALFWYIRAAIGCTHRLEGQTIHIPLTTQEQIWRLNSVIQQYQLLHPGAFPPDEHVRKVTGWSKLSVTRIKQASALSERSYDVMAKADGSSAAQMGSHVGESLIDSLTGGDTESEHIQRSSLMQMDVQSLVTRLPDPLGMVVQLRYGLQDGEAKSYEEVAKCLNLSAYKVAQHHRAALAVLQSSESLRQLASAF